MAGPTKPPAPKRADPLVGGRRQGWYVGAWGRLAMAVAGQNALLDPVPPHPDAAATLVGDARRHRGQAAFSQALGTGCSVAVATCRAVSELAGVREFSAAWALAEAVRRMPGAGQAGTAGHAVLLHRRGQLVRAWELVRELDDSVLREALLLEAVDAAMAVDTEESRAVALRLVATPHDIGDADLVDLAGRFLAMGAAPTAAAMVAELDSRPDARLDQRRTHVVGLLDGWLADHPVDVPEESVPIGIIDYSSPDHVLTSGNLGDYVQTLALLGNLARLTDVTFTGEHGLGEVATELQGLVQPRFRVPGVGGSMHLLPIDRDFSSMARVPQGTWAVAFGWHMHPLFDLRYDFPYTDHVRPIFVSFHVNRLEMLSEEALAYLREHGPVGCRDWTTVNLLLSAGVDAFFTGCFTSTVDTLFPARDEVFVGGRVVGVIDRPRGSLGQAADVREFTHQSDDFRFMAPAEGVRCAHARLATYQRDLDRVVTSRLHAYLPLTSLGVPVDFRPGSPGDVRFAGLVGMAPGAPQLDAMRDGIRELLAAVFTTILAGAGPGEVRARWCELTADRVAEAKRRFAEPLDAAEPTLDVEALAATALAGARSLGPHDAVDPDDLVDLVLAYDANLTWPAAVFLQSVIDHASTPVRLWVLTRGIDHSYGEWLAAAFPAVPMTFLPCDDVSYDADAGPARRFPGRITVSTMDRILLPLLLPEVHRVLYLDVDTVVLDDITELFRTDLDGHPVAVRDSNVSEASEWAAAGRRLPETEALALRRWMGREHPFGGRAINAGVLVMDLDRMRSDDFTARYLALGARFGLHDQDTMLMYLGPDRVHLPARWNALPVHEDVQDPAVIHWASLGKPWDAELTVHQQLWRAVADRLEERVGRPPA